MSTDNNVIAITDRGIKLYPITSAEAKAIKDKWETIIFDYYEGKSADGKTLIYSDCSTGCYGKDLAGANYDKYVKIIKYPYCGKIDGKGTNMCNGCLNFMG